MRTGRKLQNRERVEKCKETLDQLSRFMGDILDGKLSQREAAEALGLTAQGLSHELDFCFKQYLKHSHVFSDEDIRNLLGDVETPAEKLAKDVLQVGEDGRYLLVNKECQKDFIEEVKNTLNERDYFILSQYYKDNYSYIIEGYTITAGDINMNFSDCSPSGCRAAGVIDMLPRNFSINMNWTEGELKKKAELLMQTAIKLGNEFMPYNPVGGEIQMVYLK